MNVSGPKRKFPDSRRGMNLVEILVALSILGALAMGVMKWFQYMGKAGTGMTAARTAQQLRMNVIQTVNSPTAWRKTVEAQAEGTLKCLAEKTDCRDSKGPLTLANSAGEVEFDEDPGAGFTMGGAPCDGFNPDGSPSCPFRVDVEWEPICSSSPPAPCLNPQVRIVANIRYRPQAQGRGPAFNEGNYAVNLIRGQGPSSPSEFCTALGGEWDDESQKCGIERLVCGILGGTFSADTESCSIPLDTVCPEGQALHRLAIQDGRTEPTCIPVEDDFDPFDFHLVVRPWSDPVLRQIPQDEVQGCATSAAAAGAELNGFKCRQDRAAGSTGTCYYRIPVISGVVRNDLAGWFRRGSGYCRGGIFTSQSYAPPFSPY